MNLLQKILIADDEPRMRQVLKQLVAPLVHEVFEAADGAEGIALYAVQRPDWVLMDWRMKPLDGLHATARIKAQFPEARICIVSQYDEPEMRSLAMQAGACAYIAKDDLWQLLGLLSDECPPGTPAPITPPLPAASAP